MQTFNGKKEAKLLDAKIEELISSDSKIRELVRKDLAIIQIGENEESAKYIKLKQKIGTRLGLSVSLYKFHAQLSNLELENLCKEIFSSTDVGGVIVQLPLPRESLEYILNDIPPQKDIDLLSDEMRYKAYHSSTSRRSPVVRSAEHFIYSLDEHEKDGTAIVVGGGELVGIPVAIELKNKGWEVIVDENYYEGKELDADLIVLSTGIPHLVKPTDIVKGANVIDFGSSVVDGKTVGDLDTSDMKNLDHLGLVSLSPGGMGPLVVRYLFLNFLGK